MLTVGIYFYLVVVQICSCQFNWDLQSQIKKEKSTMELKSQTKANENVWCQLYTNC